jgi:outer membrane protein OmpA-like peptidoglycan-associated protein
MFRNVFPSFSPRQLILALVLTSAITAGTTPHSVNAGVTNNAGNWAGDEWVCSKGTPPIYGTNYYIGVEYDCTLTAASGRVMTARPTNSWGKTTSDVNTNLVNKGLTVTLTDNGTKIRVTGTPIARTSTTSGLSKLRYEFNTNETPAVYKGTEELEFQTELMRANGRVTVSPTQPALGDTVTFTATPTVLPVGYTIEYVWKDEGLNAAVVGESGTTLSVVADYGSTVRSAWSITSWTDGTNSVIGVPLTSWSSLDLVGSANFSIQRPGAVTVVTTTTTVAPTATTVAPTATTVAPTAATVAPTVAPSALASRYVNAVPGITVTDPVVYRTAPKRVAENSAVIVLTAQQTRTLDVVSRTPAVCLPNDNDLVFINQGSCIADVVNQRTRAVLRTLRTKVVGDNIEQLLVGNEIVTLAPVYFDRMSAFIDAKGRQTLNTIRPQAIAAGSILVMGHSGIIYGNSPENKKVANDRAMAVMQALKSFGVKAPFATSSLGANDPASKATSEKAQDRNRRVIIALIP